MPNLTIKLFDGTEFPCLGVGGKGYYYQGMNRDSLTFCFDKDSVSISDLVEKFTEDNCKAITIIGDTESVYYNYKIIDQIGIGNYSSIADGPVSPSDDMKCLFVRLIQTTLSERLWERHEEELNNIIVSLLEV